ncbi:MAG TPA: hypothetical protein DEH78_18980 [Solibacterales bacterium]|nr:hypothetical protein [Bryobacterales bacterium]
MNEDWKRIAEEPALAELRIALAPRIAEIERAVLRDPMSEVEHARLQGEYAAYDAVLNLPRLRAEHAEATRGLRRKAETKEVLPYRREVR